MPYSLFFYSYFKLKTNSFKTEQEDDIIADSWIIYWCLHYKPGKPNIVNMEAILTHVVLGLKNVHIKTKFLFFNKLDSSQ